MNAGKYTLIILDRMLNQLKVIWHWIDELITCHYNRLVMKWQSLSEKKKNKYLILIYTIMFCLLAAICFSPFYLSGRTFIWKIDGLRIEMPSRIYLVNYIKSIWQTLSAGSLNIPVFDFNLFEGTDSLQFLSVWYLEPINLLGALIPVKYFESFFSFLVIIHYYLAGLGFICYARFIKGRALSSLIGSFIYIFSGYALHLGVKHPVFLSPMFYLPMLIIGVEMIMQNKKTLMFTFFVFLSAWSSYFFLYQNTVIVFIYVALKTIFIKKYCIKKNFQLLCKMTIYYLLGIIMSLMSLVPAITAFLYSNRENIYPGYDNLLYYPMSWYIKLLGYFFVPRNVGNFLILGFPVVVIFCILTLFRKKHHGASKLMFLIAMIGLLTPSISLAMNAFSIVQFRWCYVYGLIIAIIVVQTIEDIYYFKLKYKYVYLCLLIAAFLAGNRINYIGGITYSALTLFLIFLFLVLFVFKINIRYKKIIIVSSVLINIIVNALWMYWPTPGFGGNLTYAYAFKGHSSVQEHLVSKLTPLAEVIEDDSYYRISRTDERNYDTINSEVIFGIPSSIAYYNTLDKKQFEYYLQLGLDTVANNLTVGGLDFRTNLLALHGVKYLIAEQDNDVKIPYGFVPYKFIDNDTAIYKNKYFLPVGITYSDYITDSQFNALLPLEKQNVLMDAVVLNDAYENNNITKLSNEELTNKNIIENDLSITDMQNIKTLGKNHYYVGENAVITYQINTLPKSESYIYFNGYNNDKISWNESTLNGSNLFTSYIDDKKREVIIPKTNSTHNYTTHQTDYLVNLGYNEDSMTEFKIKFNFSGEIYLNTPQCFSQKMDTFEQSIEKLKSESMQDVVFSNNRLDGTINVSSDKMLYFNFPYSGGWKAYVDGKETDILVANTAYMAIPLQAGIHRVSLVYQPVLLKEAAYMSLIAWMIFICCLIKNKKHKLKEM